MVSINVLPIDGEGVCMLCKETPSQEKKVTCITCVTPWHMDCLENPPVTLSSIITFECPDCAGTGLEGVTVPPPTSADGELVAKIREIEADTSMMEEEKARRRQELVSGKQIQINKNERDEGEEKNVLVVLGESIKCPFCYTLPDRPVTTSCGHNFCLKCFKKWIGQGRDTCVKCRSQISRQMINQPRINSALVTAIRMAKESRKNDTPRRPQAAYPQMNQEDRPDSPFIREGAAKRAGMANASSGRIFVTVPSDHFGPILAENDPERNQGVLVGESWTHRLNCRQWGVHWPHVAGIAGRAKYGAQSVVLSGGYEDDEDHGEWLLYTGSGGRDLSGNKRTNKDQSFDQSFTNFNDALRVSCKQGYPVRVVRSHKEKRSSYAPQDGLRYDGVYRIEKCWRKMGKQGEEDRWKWKKPPPPSQQRVVEVSLKDGKRTKNKTPRKSQKTSVKDTLLKGFGCVLCKNVLTLPVTTPCAHNFCKACLEEAFKGQSFIKERECHNRRKLRSQKNFMKCPACALDISELLQNPQVNRELEDAIGKLREEFYKSDNHKEDANEEAIKEETSSENRMSNDESLSNDKKLRRAYKKKKTDAGNNSTNNDGN